MQILLSELKIGKKATISTINIDELPLKLIEMGCLPGNSVEVVQIAPLGDPIYINVNDSHVAIRKETAKEVVITLTDTI